MGTDKHRLAIVEELDQLFGELDFRSFHLAATSVNEVAREYAIKTIANDVLAARLIGTHGDIIWGGHHYLVACGPDVWDASTLQFAIVPIAPTPHSGRKPAARRTSITGFGSYKRIALCSPPEIDADLDLALDILAAAFGAAYVWLEARFFQLLADTRNQTSDVLYGELRLLFGPSEETSQVWLVAIIKGHGYFFLDRVKAEGTLEAIDEVSRSFGGSALHLASEILNSELEFETMNSRIAVEKGQCIDVDIFESAFAESRPHYIRAIAAMVHSPDHSIYPVVRSGKQLLLAGFPAASRSKLEPLFQAHQKRLATLFVDRASRIAKIRRAYGRAVSGLGAGAIGEFAGGLTKGLLS